MKHNPYSSTKKGAASLYVVIFATILFGVITLSFIRIILSESNQSSNDDLSQSAYDSALAGVEDAKIAVNRYYQCPSNVALPILAASIRSLTGILMVTVMLMVIAKTSSSKATLATIMKVKS